MKISETGLKTISNTLRIAQEGIVSKGTAKYLGMAIEEGLESFIESIYCEWTQNQDITQYCLMHIAQACIDKLQEGVK